MNPLLDRPPRAVVEHFAPATSGLTWHRAEQGFSGAAVWRGDDANGAPQVALKGWSLGTTAERLQQIHLWVSRGAHLPFVPTIFTSPRGLSVIDADGQLWDACKWMVGVPRMAPTAVEVCAACEAVARLHRCWPVAPDRGPCRGVAARLDILTKHQALLDVWSREVPPVAPELGLLLRRAVREVARISDSAIAALRSWTMRNFHLGPCVRDLRGEHVLFEADRVSGIIDFGAMTVDVSAIDLARLLGDYAAAEPALFSTGLNAYRAAGGALDAPDDFVNVLARTGAVCSVLGWLVRVFVRREPVLRPAAAERLGQLLARVERVPHV